MASNDLNLGINVHASVVIDEDALEIYNVTRHSVPASAEVGFSETMGQNLLEVTDVGPAGFWFARLMLLDLSSPTCNSK
jgi:hypothetical protein